MKERNEIGQEAPVLHAFEVFYHKSVSTWNNDWESRGKKIMMLESKPFGEDRRKLEMTMEDDFINAHRKQRKNLADVSYKITKIRAITPEN